MTDGLFESNNCNADVFVVPTQEGPVEEDQGHGSIGDATAKHVSNLDHSQRQLWEGLFQSRNGAIFRFIPSSSWHDRDPFNLKGKDLEYFFSDYVEDHYPDGKIPEKDAIALVEAINEEKQRRSESEDVYDASVSLIPFDEWEKYPGMFSHVDIPSTPKDILVYMGNCTQVFYDYFPEGHPDSKVMNDLLIRINKPAEDLTDNYLDFLQNWLEQQKITKPYVLKYLAKLLGDLKDEACIPENTISSTLSAIDTCWATEFLNDTVRASSTDKILHLLVHKRSEYRKQFKAGKSVFGSLKAFGAFLFQNYKQELKSHHWAIYKRMKLDFAPRVMLNGQDINRCGLSALKRMTQDTNKAEQMWYSRPFNTINEAFNKGYLTRQAFSLDDETLDQILDLVDRYVAKAKEISDQKVLAPLVKALVDGQQAGVLSFRGQKLKLSPAQWNSVWTYYRLVRGEKEVKDE